MTAANSVKTPGMKDPIPDYNIVKGDDQPTTATTFGNHLAPSSSESATGRILCCAVMTNQDPNPDHMDVDSPVDCSMGVDCGTTDISDYNDSDIEAMEDEKREHVRRRVTLSENNWRVRFDETSNSYHDVAPYSKPYNEIHPS